MDAPGDLEAAGGELEAAFVWPCVIASMIGDPGVRLPQNLPLLLKASSTPSVTQQPQAGQPPPQQGARLLGAGRRSSRRSGRGAGRPPGRCLLVGHGGAAVQVGREQAPAASDVVHAAEGRVSSVGQREAGLLLRDGVVAQVSVQTLGAW